MGRHKSMSPEERKFIVEQIKKALDGRTKRWLSLEVKIAEAELSKKMNCLMAFTMEEIKRIEERLNFVIQLPVGTEQ